MLRGASTVADLFVSEVVRHKLVSIDHEIALRADLVSIDYQLHMADALVYSVATDYKAELVTTDSHFKDLPFLQWSERSAHLSALWHHSAVLLPLGARSHPSAPLGENLQHHPPHQCLACLTPLEFNSSWKPNRRKAKCH